ncbi:hypothetical protein KA005_51735, partial [bacterium]|nr:hypothetical protein [bacterium]
MHQWPAHGRGCFPKQARDVLVGVSVVSTGGKYGVGGKMVWACPSLSLGSGYSGVPSAFGRPLRAPSIPHAVHGKLIKVSIKWFCKELMRMLEKGGAT